jgi:hypothetical protein
MKGVEPTFPNAIVGDVRRRENFANPIGNDIKRPDDFGRFARDPSVRSVT